MPPCANKQICTLRNTSFKKLFLQNIKRVDVRKRLETRFLDAFYNVEVRVGNTDIKSHPLKTITAGTKCGETGPRVGNHFPFASYLCNSGLSGRYLTAQEMSDIHFQVSEIDVYTTSKNSKSTLISVPLHIFFHIRRILSWRSPICLPTGKLLLQVQFGKECPSEGLWFRLHQFAIRVLLGWPVHWVQT